jgi:very-short-patch-repair endonuclease
VGHVFHAIDSEIARLARAQGGAVGRAQLRAMGFGRGAIDHRIDRERLHRTLRGVYLAGHSAETELAPYWAALISGGPASYITAGSALELYGAAEPEGGPVHITVIAGRRRKRRGVLPHRTRRFNPQDFGLLDGVLPITSPARAALDYAEYATPRQLERVVNVLHYKGLASPQDLHDVIARTPGRHGTPLLKAVLARHEGPVRFRSGGERIVLAILKRARLPRPEVNAIAEGEEIDFLYRDPKVAIELDGGAAHGTPAAVDRDRRKDAYMRSKGYEVLRYSWWQIEEETEAVIAEISAKLAARTRSS